MITVISTPGHMATRWLAECFARNDECLVTHANSIIFPTNNIEALKDGDSVAALDKETIQLDWPGYDEITNEDVFVDYLERLRLKYNKKVLIAIHTAPVSCGSYFKNSLLKKGGRFIYLVREPIQKIDSQMRDWDNLDYMINQPNSKTKFYRNVLQNYFKTVNQSETLSLSSKV